MGIYLIRFLQILFLFTPLALSKKHNDDMFMNYELYNEFFHHDEQPELRSQENVRKMQLEKKETYSPEVKKVILTKCYHFEIFLKSVLTYHLSFTLPIEAQQ